MSILGRLVKLTLSRGAKDVTPPRIRVLLEEAEAHESRGAVAAAIAALEKALEIDRGHAPALHRLGVLQARSGALDAARTSLERAMELVPSDPDVSNALGNVYRLLRKWDAATAMYERALGLDPDRVSALSNLGICLKNAGYPERAIEYLRKANAIGPFDPQVLLNLGLGMIDLGNSVQGERYLRQALALAPEMAEAHLALAFELLKAGRFEDGWREYEWRRKVEEWEQRQECGCPQWRGEPLQDRVVFVRSEQGLGDQVMFASCLAEVIARAARTIVECDPRLEPIFTRSFPQAEIHARVREGDNAEWYRTGGGAHYQVDIGSLPGIFRRGIEGFPHHEGYLHADPQKVARWRARLATAGASRALGISWRGGTHNSRRAARSVALAELLPLFRTQGIRFVSLQYGDCAREIAALSREHGVTLEHWQPAIDDYDETAALIAALDGVVSVQTAAVHLAGALGRPAWVMIPVVPEWRYLARGKRMAWYPTVRMYRQAKTGDWRDVVERIATVL